MAMDKDSGRSSKSTKPTGGASGPVDTQAPGPSLVEGQSPPALPATHTAARAAAQQAHAAAAKAAAPAPARPARRKVEPPAAAAPATASTANPAAPTPADASTACASSSSAPPPPKPPAPKPPAPKAAARGSGLTHKRFVIGGMSFEVDSRYHLKSVVGKGAYGLVCAADDTLATASPSGAPPEAAAHSMVALTKL